MRRMRRRSSSRRSSRSGGRTREWNAFTTVDTGNGSFAAHINLPNNSVYANYLLSPDDMTVFYDEPTLVRSILHFSAVGAASVGANNDMWLSMGYIKWDAEVGAAGAVPAGLLPFVPLPFIDADSPWIWQYHQSIPNGPVAGTVRLDAAVDGNGLVDIRTKRKFENGSGLLFVATATRSDGGQINLAVSGRLLWLNR